MLQSCAFKDSRRWIFPLSNGAVFMGYICRRASSRRLIELRRHQSLCWKGSDGERVEEPLRSRRIGDQAFPLRFLLCGGPTGDCNIHNGIMVFVVRATMSNFRSICMKLAFVTMNVFRFPYSIVIDDYYSGDARYMVVNDHTMSQSYTDYKWWWTMLVMDVRFLLIAPDLYNFLIDRLLHVHHCT